MSDASAVLEQLRSLGFDLVPDPPLIRVRYLFDGELPPEADPLIEELRAHKAAALEQPGTWVTE